MWSGAFCCSCKSTLLKSFQCLQCLSYLRAVPRGAAHEKGPLSTFCHGSFNRVQELQLLVPLAYWKCFLSSGWGCQHKCLYLTTCEIKLFACCGRSKGEQCCIMEERGKPLTVTQCHYNSSLCVNDNMAVRHIRCYFQFTLVLPVHSSWVGGDYVTHSCVAKVSLFLFYFLHFLISNTSKNLILSVVINWRMTSDLGNLDVWLLSHKY